MGQESSAVGLELTDSGVLTEHVYGQAESLLEALDRAEARLPGP